MKVQVRFRFNKLTGEVEEFLIDDHESDLSATEHNRRHDRIANEVGRVIAQHPRIQEVSGAAVAGRQEEPSETGAPTTPRQRQKS
ncbi:MAG: hypothetical protein GY862_07580 [Gammaproteobacteria bacterium]|nr:hypothetical protein [Gammaproteobacteria bacterium]